MPKNVPSGKWITGGNWDHENWKPAALPTHQLIDEVTANWPVFINRLDGHMSLANATALKLAGIDRKTRDVPGGVIVRDAGGNPTGILKDAAQDLVYKVIPPPTQDQIIHAIRAAQNNANSVGVTSVQDMSASPEIFRAYQTMLRDSLLHVRISGHQPLPTWKRLADLGVTADFGNDYLHSGIRVTFVGQMRDVLIEGGLEDSLSGYSADLTFAPSLSGPATASPNQYAMLGLMTGPADPMLKFPAGTIFTPYANVRNISNQNELVTPVIWWMEGTAPRSERLAQFTVLPFHSTHLDVLALLAAAGLQKFKGNINLVLETVGPLHSLLIASGSVDHKNTYVFSVPPSSTREGVAKSLSYWSTANGDDTMVTLWNPADDPQNFTFTLFFSGGQYELPVHLEGRVSRSFNISEIIDNQIPDAEGRTIPVAVHEGSAEVAGSKGANQHILIGMAAGTYNVLKATCQWYCITCQGAVRGVVSALAVEVNQSQQLTFTIYNHDGTQFDDTQGASWSSSNPSVATIAGNGFGLINGVSAGSVTITASDDGVPDYDAKLCTYGDYPDCGSVVGKSGSASGTVTQPVPAYLTVSVGNRISHAGDIAKYPDGTPINPNPCWGYSRVYTYQIWGNDNQKFTQAGTLAVEINTTTASNPSSLKLQPSVTAGTLQGYFYDGQLDCTSGPPGPPAGTYIKGNQQLNIVVGSQTFSNIRTNYIDLEATDVSVTCTSNCH